MGDSVWSKTVAIAPRKALDGNIETEVAVIGAGMAGILIAYFLQEAGKQVVILEADRIASGQTKNTTAKITSQHGCIYSKLKKDFGMGAAELYAEANEEAIAEYQRIIEENDISCHFERLPAYLYSMADEKSLRKEAEVAASLGISAYYTKEVKLPFGTAGAVCFENQAQFHPLEFIRQITEDITICEKTKVLSVNGHLITTNRGTVKAQSIIFATHYPITNIPGFYFLRQHQQRSYVLALKNVKEVKGMYYSIDTKGLSLRMEEDILLLGGGGHRTGKGEAGKGYKFLRKAAEKYFPEHEEIASWSAQDCIPHDGLPFVGKYSSLRPYWYVATGFHKWGMSTSMIAAGVIRDQICGISNPYEEVFSPQRIHLKAGFTAFIKDVGTSVKGLLMGALHLPFSGVASLKPGQGKIIRIGLFRYGCYKEKNGKIHKIPVRCPHMGCELEWNGQEHTWDCPCHGSRYNIDGELIDNPAQVDIYL